MSVLAIDPGPEKSAWLLWNGREILTAFIFSNSDLLAHFKHLAAVEYPDCYIEMIASYGMAVGKEVFQTCVWIGRFMEAWKRERGIGQLPGLVFRQDVKLHHCQSNRAKDSNIRQALIDKYGAPGTKRAQGVTYGLKQDLWQAFALATYVTETKEGCHVTSDSSPERKTNLTPLVSV